MGQLSELRPASVTQPKRRLSLLTKVSIVTSTIGILLLTRLHHPTWPSHCFHKHHPSSPAYGHFPKKHDPFHFIPCTNLTSPPGPDDATPDKTWADLYQPNPDHWIWGVANHTARSAAQDDEDVYAGRGIFLCGYLDVPYDYANTSDTRIFRVAITKYQVSGLARIDGRSPPSAYASAFASAGQKSERTLVLEPGGPGGSGTWYAFSQAQNLTERFSDGKFDVLGFDPRGVNATQPILSCSPHDADRDRWSIFTQRNPELAGSPRQQLEITDAMNAATMRSCWETLGDLPRFVTTALVTRDIDEIRKALGEEELTGYLVSYGTTIGQHYANLFPSKVGRIILDGIASARDDRELGGFGRFSVENITDAWHDGFLGECVDAGPQHCALAKPGKDGKPVTLSSLEARMDRLFKSLATRPMPAYTPRSGPSLITYSVLLSNVFRALYNAVTWPACAEMLAALEAGNTTLAADMIDSSYWAYDPALPLREQAQKKPQSLDSTSLIVCADGYDAPLPENGLVWWEELWETMHNQSIFATGFFYSAFPCPNFPTYWPTVAEVYRGDLNSTLKNPVLLISETHDPATPISGGRRVHAEMGYNNSRFIVHHGYGHSSRDRSACTDAIAKAYILHGEVPDESVTDCYADEKPYRYGQKTKGGVHVRDPIEVWREHVQEMASMRPAMLLGR